ncbi:DUF2127 domain-containing protein [Methylophilus aquaticus]|uniref:DUF2127 domain-containing protein n=1 Tax=Methylophilus aquaticus TaxID=1971610 RepID=A0ABT9JQW2_9PROT|nr:DUF2127 domain-containing protein [Methylophilus aquaticus]
MGIRAIALFEGGKAMLMLVALLIFIFSFHLNARELSEALVSQLHINPQGHYVRLLLKMAANFTRAEIIAASACAFLYTVIKFSESVGLWNQRQWGRTLGIASIGVLIPYEVYALLHHYTHFNLIALLVNSGIVLYLFIFFNRRSIPSSVSNHFQ